MGTDLAERVNFDRLRTERLGKAKETLRESELGAVLCFDMNNIRYLTATAIGTWAMDKLVRFSLLAQDDDPILWDFGSRRVTTNCIARGWGRSAPVWHFDSAGGDASGGRPGRGCGPEDQD